MGASAQPDPKKNFSWIRITSSHTAFPDKARSNGYSYEGKFFDAVGHYSDSTVLMVVPKSIRKQEKVDLVFWFHGWNNNIDTASAYFQIEQQFTGADCGAVLVLAETAKNAPDSYGGKLEQPGDFAGLVEDVMATLKKEKQIAEHCKPGNIILAGHSGAYRAMAYILQNGGAPVREVELFDALYSQVDKFLYWIQKDKDNRFIHWYTNHGGGTDEVSAQMMDTLRKTNTSFILSEENNVTPSLLQTGRIFFIHSEREHNEIISNPPNFKLLLKGSSVCIPALK
jgi:hypothetical protein